MMLRKTTHSDISRVMEIICSAQKSLRDMGIDQWQNNYPNESVIAGDINKGISYVLLKDDMIVATAALSFEKEPAYEKIYGGKCLNDKVYAVVHRLAVSESDKRIGIASLFMNMIRDLCIQKKVFSIKIDTHRNNMPMQNMLKKNGYQYCGIIYLGDGFENCGAERFAFELVIEPAF